MRTIEELVLEIMSSIPRHIERNNIGSASYQFSEEDVEQGIIRALKEQHKETVEMACEVLEKEGFFNDASGYYKYWKKDQFLFKMDV